MPFAEALLHARSLKLTNKKAWHAFSKSGARPVNSPSLPDRAYQHDGWQGYGHWLGTGNVAEKDKQFLPFKDALLYARSLKLKSAKEWVQWYKIGAPLPRIPSCPHKTYTHNGWQGWGHWLGTDNVAGGQRLQFLPFKKALVYVRSLKLKSVNEWEAWQTACQCPLLPAQNLHAQ